MTNELVSIIIPSFNSRKTIKLCLDAVYRQTYDFYEVIVVDDCSTDDSPEIIKDYPCRFFSTPQNLKVAGTRNLGAEYAKGSILFFVDSDVVLLPDAVFNVVTEMQKEPDIGCVCGIYTDKPLIRDSIFEEYRALQNHYWQLSSEGLVTPGNFAIGAVKKKVFDEIGKFNPKLTQCEEVEYGIRLSERYKLLFTSKIRGEHDHDEKLSIIMKKLFERARQRIPLYLKRKKFMKGFETGNRAFGILFAFISVFSLPIVFLKPFYYISFIPLLFFLGFILADWKQYVYVYKKKNVSFLIFFILVHYLVSINIFCGLIKGLLDFCFKKRFRENYK